MFNFGCRRYRISCAFGAAVKQPRQRRGACLGVASEPQGETRSRVKIKKTTHVAGCIAAPGAVVNVSKETADRLVADGMGVILY